MKIKDFDDAINLGVASADWSRMEKWIVENSSFVYDNFTEEANFPEDVFGSIINLFNQKKFLDAEGSHNVLSIIESDWAILTNQQKERLMPLLEKSYYHFRDAMSWFLISEIFGRFYCNEASLQTLCRLNYGQQLEASSLLPMGIHYVATSCPDAHVREAAVNALKRMSNDSNELTSEEASKFLERLRVDV